MAEIVCFLTRDRRSRVYIYGGNDCGSDDQDLVFEGRVRAFVIAQKSLSRVESSWKTDEEHQVSSFPETELELTVNVINDVRRV